MSSRSKKRKQKRRGVDLFQVARQAYEKRNFKQALKDAKVCYRQNPTEQCRQLLEQSYCARVRELDRMGMQPQARHAVNELMSLGITNASVRQELREILFTMGLEAELAALGEEELPPEERARLLADSADRALLKSGSGAPVLPELQVAAQAVRQALEAIERGDEQAANERLAGIPRQSPFADWKLFVRGLAAYYRHDHSQMIANWDRLDSRRAAARIASTLRQLDNGANLDCNLTMSRLSRLERAVFQSNTIVALNPLHRNMVENDVDEFPATLQRWHGELAKLRPELYERLVSVLCDWDLHRCQGELHFQLTKWLTPPAIDPHWHRARALLAESEQDEDLVEDAWASYADDVSHSSALAPQDRPRAASLVWLRLGRYFAFQYQHMYDFVNDDEAPVESEEYRRAIRYFWRSIAAHPHPDAYIELAAFQQRWKMHDEAAETYLKLLEQDPNNFQALVELGKHYSDADEPHRARQYLLQAHQLHPLDDQLTKLIRDAHIGSARHLALSHRWEEGRAALKLAEELDCAEAPYVLPVHWAVFELTAGCEDEGKKWIERAMDSGPEPTAPLLMLSIEAARYQLPQHRQFTRQWQQRLKKRCTSWTAGEMARIMTNCLKKELDYSGNSMHIDCVVEYIRRTVRVPYQVEHLRSVCEFLKAARCWDDHERMILKGTRKFSYDPYFHVELGELEIDKGPRECDRRKAKKAFEKALKLTAGQDGEAIRTLQKTAREQLAFLEEVGMESLSPESFAHFASQLPPEFAEHAEELIDAMCGRTDLHEVLEKVAAMYEESNDFEMFEEVYSEEEYSNETYQRSPARRKQKA